MQLKSMLPFQIINDGEVIATVLPVCDVNKLKQQAKASHDVNKPRPVGKKLYEPSHDVNKTGELRFSKARQVSGRM